MVETLVNVGDPSSNRVASDGRELDHQRAKYSTAKIADTESSTVPSVRSVSVSSCGSVLSSASTALFFSAASSAAASLAAVCPRAAPRARVATGEQHQSSDRVATVTVFGFPNGLGASQRLVSRAQGLEGHYYNTRYPLRVWASVSWLVEPGGL